MQQDKIFYEQARDFANLSMTLDSSQIDIKDVEEDDGNEIDGIDEEESDDEDTKELQPLYLFLASSLNVELVYIILKSISMFSSVTVDEYGNSILKDTDDDVNAVLHEDRDKATLAIHEMQIKDPNRWVSSLSMENYIQNNRMTSRLRSFLSDTSKSFHNSVSRANSKNSNNSNDEPQPNIQMMSTSDLNNENDSDSTTIVTRSNI